MTRDEWIDQLVTYLTLAEEEKAPNWPKACITTMRSFDEAMPFQTADSAMKNKIDSQSRMFRARYEPSWVRRSWDSCLIGDTNNASNTPDALFTLSRFRKVSMSAARGQRIYSKYLGEHSTGIVLSNGLMISNYRSLWNYNGTKWVQLAHAGCLVDAHEPEDTTQFRLSLHLQEYQYSDHFWHVTLGYPDSAKLKLRTDPEGAREVFRLRDIPAGRDRRAAIKHWVSQHYRTRPTTGDKDVSVRKHLRGVEEFIWNGLYCKIAPSLAELHHYWPDKYPEPEPWPEERRKHDIEQGLDT